MAMHDDGLGFAWPLVREQLPEPARVLEIGCGPHGGFVPELRTRGHEAVGVDPEAPEEPGFHRIVFEQYAPTTPFDAVVACTSLHHVADIAAVLDKVAGLLTPGGRLVVAEWDWERFDEPTARWCFDHLGPLENGEHSWLHEHRSRCAATGQTWEAYVRDWAQQEGMHTWGDILAALDARFDAELCQRQPYFFVDLPDVSRSTEQAAIDAGQISASGIWYVGRPK